MAAGASDGSDKGVAFDRTVLPRNAKLASVVLNVFSIWADVPRASTSWPLGTVLVTAKPCAFSQRWTAATSARAGA